MPAVGQPLHRFANGAVPPGRIRTVCPAGHVTVRPPVSISKSSRWNPSSMWGLRTMGFTAADRGVTKIVERFERRTGRVRRIRNDFGDPGVLRQRDPQCCRRLGCWQRLGPRR